MIEAEGAPRPGATRLVAEVYSVPAFPPNSLQDPVE